MFPFEPHSAGPVMFFHPQHWAEKWMMFSVPHVSGIPSVENKIVSSFSHKEFSLNSAGKNGFIFVYLIVF